MTTAPPFDRAALERALEELGRRAHAEGKTIEIAIYGGSALMLLFDWRLATRDVDAVFEADRAQEHGWDEGWLNDGVKGFLSAADSDADAKRLFRTYPSEAEPGLRVMVANPRYLFAMKCRAMRIGGVEASTDVEDIRGLARELGISDAAEAIDLVTAFYPGHRLGPKVQFGLEEIFSGASPAQPGTGVP
jgi:hypothetical protein